MKVKCLSLFSALLWFSQSLLHFLLMLGLPMGRLVFGGAYIVFPLWLRPVNFLLFLLWGFFSLSYLSLGGWLRSTFLAFLSSVILLHNNKKSYQS